MDGPQHGLIKLLVRLHPPSASDMQILRHHVAARLLRDDAAQLKAPVLVLSLPPASPRELIDVYVCYTSIHVCFLWEVLLAANPSYAYATLGRAPYAPSLTVAFIPRLSSFFVQVDELPLWAAC